MILRLVLILAALGAALVPLPAAPVEHFYSERAYLALQRVMTRLSNAVPFAVFDLLLAVLVLWLVLLWLAWMRGRRKSGALRATGQLAARVAAGAAVVYLVFLATWGLNYRRVPLRSRLAFSHDRATREAVTALANDVIARANLLHDAGHPGAGGDDLPRWSAVVPMLAPSFARVQRQLAPVVPAVPGRPKGTVLNIYFERSAVDGMTDPFFLETLVNTSVLPFERPFITAHEWAHLAGYADESEANFLGWLTCLQGPPAAEYSGHLALLWQVLPALPREEREAFVRHLGPGVRADLKAMAERAARATPFIRRVSWRVYDRYLKANRVEKGVESYDAALELMLGTRFGPGWVPALTNAE